LQPPPYMLACQFHHPTIDNKANKPPCLTFTRLCFRWCINYQYYFSYHMASRIAINKVTSFMYHHNLKYIKTWVSHLGVREWILSWFLSHFGIRARFQIRSWVWVKESTESLSFLRVFLTKKSCHLRNSTLRPFFCKTNAAIAFGRPKNLGLEVFVTNGASTSHQMPHQSSRRTTTRRNKPPPEV